MKNVRVGIIGMGNIGKHHAGYLLEGKVARCQLTAVCSTSPDKLADYATKGVKVFGDAMELIRSKILLQRSELPAGEKLGAPLLDFACPPGAHATVRPTSAERPGSRRSAGSPRDRSR